MVLTAVFVVIVFVYGLVSQRLQRTVITAPMLFTAVGAATILLPEAARELVLDRKVLLLIAELGLVMLLFTDASRINRSLLTAGRSLPIRLLIVSMPLAIVFGAVCAIVVLSGLSWGEAGILAAILAPATAPGSLRETWAAGSRCSSAAACANDSVAGLRPTTRSSTRWNSELVPGRRIEPA